MSKKLKNVINVTEEAQEKMRALLDLYPALGLRLSLTKKGCSGLSYNLEYVKEGQINKQDQMLEFEGFKLFLDNKAFMYVLNSEIDFVKDEFKAGFVFRNPNAKGNCGCGKSFYV